METYDLIDEINQAIDDHFKFVNRFFPILSELRMVKLLEII